VKHVLLNKMWRGARCDSTCVLALETEKEYNEHQLENQQNRTEMTAVSIELDEQSTRLTINQDFFIPIWLRCLAGLKGKVGLMLRSWSMEQVLCDSRAQSS